MRDRMIRLGECLKAERIKRGLSQVALGEICGVHPLSIQRIEQSKTEPKLFTICQLASRLGMTLDELVYGVSPDER